MTENDSVLDNIEIHKNFAIISVNPKLYPLSVIYSAAYWLLDRVHVIIDGDPETEILIEIRPKEKDSKVDLKEIGYEFNDELINYSVYTVQATRNKKLREMIMNNALNGNLRNSNQTNNNQPQPFRQQQTQNTQQTQKCDFPATQTPKINLNDGPISNTWKPGEQPLGNNELKDIQSKVSKSKSDDLFKGAPGIDKEGIAGVRDYRHKREEFERIN